MCSKDVGSVTVRSSNSLETLPGAEMFGQESKIFWRVLWHEDYCS